MADGAVRARLLRRLRNALPIVVSVAAFAWLLSGDQIDLGRALELIAEKQAKSKPLHTIGKHPESGEPVEVWAGRYGPYVKYQRLNATIKKDQAPETVTMEEALQLLAERAAKKGKGRRRGGRKKTT